MSGIRTHECIDKQLNAGDRPRIVIHYADGYRSAGLYGKEGAAPLGIGAYFNAVLRCRYVAGFGVIDNDQISLYELNGTKIKEFKLW